MIFKTETIVQDANIVGLFIVEKKKKKNLNGPDIYLPISEIKPSQKELLQTYPHYTEHVQFVKIFLKEIVDVAECVDFGIWPPDNMTWKWRTYIMIMIMVMEWMATDMSKILFFAI